MPTFILNNIDGHSVPAEWIEKLRINSDKPLKVTIEEMDETEFLLHDPKNSKRLMDSIKEMATGGGTERALIE